MKAVPTVAVESIVKTIHALKGVRRMRIALMFKSVQMANVSHLAIQIHVQIRNTRDATIGVTDGTAIAHRHHVEADIHVKQTRQNL